jgi:hypothetical protein
MIRILIIFTIFLKIFVIVNAYDFRIDFKPKKGESVSEFCKLWPDECEKVAFEKHYKGTLNHLCENNLERKIAQAYCNSEYKSEYVQYTDEVGKKLGGAII